MILNIFTLLILTGIVLLGLLIFIGFRIYRSRWYKTHGKEVAATVVDIEERERIYLRRTNESSNLYTTGRVYTKYKVYARWQDPLTELNYDFESRWVNTLPRVLHPNKSKVNVYIQPDEPGKYLFEL
ncbi:hypothetical protein [Ktedonospora formicarum]|uniref:DUF3592 domain-containing protein n=1 Tax=Ktedonospora formicarum TaxID=2778364 RepID=A0A8J3HWF6_9CHLR|nr:hypothetical protein [Ktedonospora formicarum]GHO42098.1 hypothetical protein KSX_02610 [Ktedonospora formicarum]